MRHGGKRMPRRFKQFILTLAGNRILQRKNGAMVLYYHGVAERVFDPVVQALHMPVNEFEEQIQYFHKHHTIISMDEFCEALRKRRLHSSQVVLTFDDGFKNNLTVVAPLLKSYGLPFTVFISTEQVENGWRYPGYQMRASIWCTEMDALTIPSLNLQLHIPTSEERLMAIELIGDKMRDLSEMKLKVVLAELRAHIPDSRWSELNEMFSTDAVMTWDDVRALHAQGVTIGSHCHSHAILHKLQDRQEIRRQIETSKRLIVEHVGECRYFSYPHGTKRDISKTAYELVKATYQLGFSTVNAPVDNFADPHLIPRVGTPSELGRLRGAMVSCRRGGGNYRKWAKQMVLQSG